MRSVRQGGVFLGSRAVNGALAVLQILLVTRAVGPSQAGRFFLLWTAAWLLSVVRGKRASWAAYAFARLSLFWLKYLDGFLTGSPGAYDVRVAAYSETSR